MAPTILRPGGRADGKRAAQSSSLAGTTPAVEGAHLKAAQPRVDDQSEPAAALSQEIKLRSLSWRKTRSRPVTPSSSISPGQGLFCGPVPGCGRPGAPTAERPRRPSAGTNAGGGRSIPGGAEVHDRLSRLVRRTGARADAPWRSLATERQGRWTHGDRFAIPLGETAESADRAESGMRFPFRQSADYFPRRVNYPGRAGGPTNSRAVRQPGESGLPRGQKLLVAGAGRVGCSTRSAVRGPGGASSPSGPIPRCCTWATRRSRTPVA